MKIRIEADDRIEENEIVIRCGTINDDILNIQRAIMRVSNKSRLAFYKDNVEYFLPVSSILFFETSEKGIDAHTIDDIFNVKTKLYELQEILPQSFVRISKSGIVNTEHIYSIDRNIASAACIKFNNSHKQVYVSRNYYRDLKNRLSDGTGQL